MMGNDTAMGKRGQVTFFIIIGIIMILIFLTLFMMVSKTAEQEGIREAEKVRQLPADIAVLSNFVQSCIELTANQGMLLLGRQGGKIFDMQGGPLRLGVPQENYLFMPGEQAYIGYSIKKLSEGFGMYSASTPDYPYDGFPMIGFPGVYHLGGIFGYVDFLALEDIAKPANNFTIKGQLKYYIENNLDKCTKGFENFRNFEVNEGEITANITFDSSTHIDVNYPLEIRKKATNEMISLNDFSSKIEVNMRGIYLFARELLHNEALNIEHQMRGKQAGSIKVIDIDKDVLDTFDDIVVIEDSSSKINAKPFRLNLLIANRQPALHYFDSFALPQLKRYYNIIGNKTDVLIIKDECGEIKYDFKKEILQLDPQNEHQQYYDPDDDVLNVTYSESLPSIIEEGDAPPYTHKKHLIIYVSDGQYSDWQEIEFDVVTGGEECST